MSGNGSAGCNPELTAPEQKAIDFYQTVFVDYDLNKAKEEVKDQANIQTLIGLINKEKAREAVTDRVTIFPHPWATAAKNKKIYILYRKQYQDSMMIGMEQTKREWKVTGFTYEKDYNGNNLPKGAKEIQF